MGRYKTTLFERCREETYGQKEKGCSQKGHSHKGTTYRQRAALAKQGILDSGRGTKFGHARDKGQATRTRSSAPYPAAVKCCQEMGDGTEKSWQLPSNTADGKSQ